MIKMYKIMIMILYECIKDIIEWIINFFCKIIIIIINIFKQMNNSHLFIFQNIFIMLITIIFLIQVFYMIFIGFISNKIIIF